MRWFVVWSPWVQAHSGDWIILKRSCCGPSFWNIQFNSLLNLNYGTRTKAIAFADDLLIAVRAENVQEAENFANIEISKILNWAKENKINFNEQK